jgi:glutamate dehydrogenase
VQLGLYARLQDLLMSRIVWFIRNVDLLERSIATVVDRFQPGIAAVGADLDDLLPVAAAEARQERTRQMISQDVPVSLAERLAGLSELAVVPDIVLVAERTGRPVRDIAATHFAVADQCRLGAIARAAEDVVTTDYYDRLALDRTVDAVCVHHRRLTAQVVSAGGTGAAGAAHWCEARGAVVSRIRDAVEGLVASGVTLSKLMVAASLLADLARE